MQIDGNWLGITALAGAFVVSAISIALGYKLFVIGATGGFKFRAATGDHHVGFESVAPGLAFALFGAAIAIYALAETFLSRG